MKLTQKQVAEMAGLQQSYVYEIETGKTNITLRTLARLAEVLRVDIRALLPETVPDTSSPGADPTLGAVLDKVVAVLQDYEQQDAERHGRQSALLEELKSLVGLLGVVAAKPRSVQESATSSKTGRVERAGCPPNHTKTD